MLSFLLSLLPSAFTTINGITNAIANAKIAALNATTEQERIAAQQTISVLEAKRDVLIQGSSHSKIYMGLTALAAVGPITYLNKIFLWDKVVAAFFDCKTINLHEELCRTFSTDPLRDPNLVWVMCAVIGFLFLSIRKV